MRIVAILLVLGTLGDALGQEPPPSLAPPPTLAPPSQSPPTLGTPPLAPPPPPSMPIVRTVPPEFEDQWHGARVMSGFATALGLISTALSLSSVIYIFATDYPPNVADFTTRSPKPSDPAQVLSYVASTTSAVAFALDAGGLGWRHHILRELEADTGRGLYVAGSIVGIAGLVGVGASYFFGFTDVLDPHQQSIAVIATSLGGAALCIIGTALYSADASRMNRAWRALTTF